jgi:anti-sigma factor RsiW
MNHPKREEWVPYVLGEAGTKEARGLKQHLEHCTECRQEIDAWRRSLGHLNAWKLPSPGRARFNSFFSPLLKWAAAAAIVLTTGFAVGRLTAAKLETETVRRAIEPELRQQLRQEFATMLREEMDRAETQRLADLVSLKKDLDTVAVMTDASLRRTERQLVQLADYAQPASYSRPNQ